MFNTLLANMLIITSIFQGSEHLEFSFGPHYSSHVLYLDGENDYSQGQLGAELGIFNIIPHIGFKIRGAKIEFTGMPHNAFYDIDAYEYIPVTFCGSFDLLPFLDVKWARLTLETGLGVYFWKGLYSGEVVILPDNSEIKEKDIGFIGGATLMLRPHKYLGLEFASRYNYIASADLYKYGFYDKDEKIWENGAGIKIIIPTR